MEEVAKRLAMIEVECGVDTSVEDYLSEFNWGLIEVVYQWALGMVSYCIHSIKLVVMYHRVR